MAPDRALFRALVVFAVSIPTANDVLAEVPGVGITELPCGLGTPVVGSDCDFNFVDCETSYLNRQHPDFHNLLIPDVEERIDTDIDILVSASFDSFGWSVDDTEIQALALQLDGVTSDSPLGYGTGQYSQDLPLLFNFYALSDTLYGQFLRHTDPRSFFWIDGKLSCLNLSDLNDQTHVDVYLSPACEKSTTCATPCAPGCCDHSNTADPSQFSDDDEDSPFEDVENIFTGPCQPEWNNNSLSIWDHNGNQLNVPDWQVASGVTFNHEFQHVLARNYRVPPLLPPCNVGAGTILDEFFASSAEYLAGATYPPGIDSNPDHDVCNEQSFPFRSDNYQIWRSWAVYLLQHFRNDPGFSDDLVREWTRTGMVGGRRNMYALWNVLKDPKYAELGCSACDPDYRGQYRLQELNNRISVARWVDNEFFGDPLAPPGEGKWGYFWDFSPGRDIGMFRKIDAGHCDWTHVLPAVKVLGDANVNTFTNVTCYADSRDSLTCPEECAPRDFCGTASTYCGSQGCGDPIDLQPWAADVLGFIAGSFSTSDRKDLDVVFDMESMTTPGHAYRYFINLITYSHAPPPDDLWDAGQSVSSITTYGPFSASSPRELHFTLPSFGCDLLESAVFVISLADSMALHPSEASFYWEMRPRLDYSYSYRVIGTGVFEFTCPPADPQCPFVYVLGQHGLVRDNNVLPGAGFLAGDLPDLPDMRDDYVLNIPIAENEERFTIVLREEANSQSRCDAVSVTAYDIGPDEVIARQVPRGAIGYVTNTRSIAGVRDMNGSPVSSELSAMDGDVVEFEAGGFVEFQWENRSSIGPEFFVVKPSLKAPSFSGGGGSLQQETGISLQLEQAGGGWEDLAAIIPRDRGEVLAISTGVIPGDAGDLVHLRLLWRSHHELDWLAVGEWTDAEGTPLLLDSATHSTQGNVGELLLSVDRRYAEFGYGESVELVFSGLQDLSSKKLCLVTTGHYIMPSALEFGGNALPDIDLEESAEQKGHSLVPLIRAYPTPSSGSVFIDLEMRRESSVEIDIFSATGNLVRRLHSGSLDPGQHQIIWDGRNGAGRAVGSGQYFYRIESGSRVQSGKIFLIR